jgi:hypothetical protein
MNIEDLPMEIRDDIEDQSLALLEGLADDIIVIGGWGVRAHLGAGHRRHTLDVDGVMDEAALPDLARKLEAMGLQVERAGWGIRSRVKYSPRVEVPDAARSAVDGVELRVEVSGPRIQELRTHHFFEFSLTDHLRRGVAYHGQPRELVISVPPKEHLAAVKLGLPVDFKNNLDATLLLQSCDIGEVARVIRACDDWREMVMKRIPKLRGRISQPGRLENEVAARAGVVIHEHLARLSELEGLLRE